MAPDPTLDIAGAGSRAYAFIIDWHIRVLLALAWLALTYNLLTLTAAGQGLSPRAATAVELWPAALLYFLYHPVLEVLMRGRTPGKNRVGLRIVDQRGSAPSLSALLIRNALRVLDSLPVFYAVGLVSTILSVQRVRLGDLAAGTVVVVDRSPAPVTDSAAGHPVAGQIDADTLSLGNEVLLRWQELSPDVRDRMARELLDRLAERPGTVQGRDLQQRLRRAVQGSPR